MKIPFSPGPVGIAWEIAQMPFVFAKLAAEFPQLVRESPRGDGSMVLVFPGFTAGDRTTAPLRRFLNAIGYRTSGWGLGLNLGVSDADQDQIEKHIIDLAEDGPITVIGWSLGGVYAREAARRRPELVRQVITLGTPIRGREGTWWIVPLFRALNPALRDEITDAGVEKHSMPITVPMAALWSPRDGVLAGTACQLRRGDESPIAENIEVDSAHIEMGFHPDVFRVIAGILARS